MAPRTKKSTEHRELERRVERRREDVIAAARTAAKRTPQNARMLLDELGDAVRDLDDAERELAGYIRGLHGLPEPVTAAEIAALNETIWATAPGATTGITEIGDTDEPAKVRP